MFRQWPCRGACYLDNAQSAPLLAAKASLVAFMLIVSPMSSASEKCPSSYGFIDSPGGKARLELCSPYLAQLMEMVKVIREEQLRQDKENGDFDRKLDRLFAAVNDVGKRINPKRQDALLRNVVRELKESRIVGKEQENHVIATLADGFDGLRARLGSEALSESATQDKVDAALDGPMGDAIANLDFSGAQRLLEDIKAQLQAIGNQVGKVNQRTEEMHEWLREQRTDVKSVVDALLSVDVSKLNWFIRANVSPKVIEESFRQKVGSSDVTVARRFFENTIDSSEAMAWFDAVLAAGVDPDMTVPSDYYGREGILLQAMRAGNMRAMKILLDRGASPHAYQDLFLTRYPETRFLFPLSFIADDSHLTLDDKKELVHACMDGGAVVPRVFPPKDKSSWSSLMFEAKKIQDEVAPRLGLSLPASPTLCEQPEGPVCKEAFHKTGLNWCAIIQSFPKKLSYSKKGDGSFSPVYDIDLMYVLNIARDEAYFLGLTEENTGSEYVLVEISKDGSNWTILRLMEPESGMGLCKKDGNGYQPDFCWRKVRLHRLAGTDQMRSDDVWGGTWDMYAGTCRLASPETKVGASGAQARSNDLDRMP
jgi:hypothetical protein